MHDCQPAPNFVHIFDPQPETADAVLNHRHPFHHTLLWWYILLHIPGTADVFPPRSRRHLVVENNSAIFRYRGVCDGIYRHGKYRVSDYPPILNVTPAKCSTDSEKEKSVPIFSGVSINSYILNLTISKWNESILRNGYRCIYCIYTLNCVYMLKFKNLKTFKTF